MMSWGLGKHGLWEPKEMWAGVGREAAAGDVLQHLRKTFRK